MISRIAVALRWTATAALMLASLQQSALADVSVCPYCSPSATQARNVQLAVLRRLLWNKRYEELDQYFDDLQRDYEAGKIADYELLWSYRAFRVTDAGYEPLFKEWQRKNPKSYAARVGAGTYYREVGYSARGSRLAAETSEEQFKGMNARFQQAIQEYHDSLSLTAKPVATYNLMMRLGKAYGNADAVKSLLDKAVAYDPISFEARLNFLLATTPRWGGSYSAMEAMVAQSERAGVKGWQLNALKNVIASDRTDAAWRDKRLDEALKYANESVRLQETFDSLYPLVRLLVDRNLYDDAFPYINRALEYYPNHTHLIAYRGYVYARRGEYESAYKEYLRAADLGYSWAQRSVAKALWEGRGAQKDREQAVTWLKKAAARGDVDAMNCPSRDLI